MATTSSTESSPKSLRKSTTRRWAKRLAYVFGGLIVVYAAYWLLVAVAVWGYAPQLISRDVGDKSLKVDAASVSGFPFAFDLRFDDFRLADKGLGLVWQPPQGALDINVAAYAPWSFTLPLAGEHRFVPIWDREATAVRIGEGQLKARMTTGRLPNAVHLQARDIQGAILNLATIEAESVLVNFERAAPNTRIDIEAKRLRMPPQVAANLARVLSKLKIAPGASEDTLAPTLGQYLESAIVKAVASPALPADPNRIRMQSWQAKGGTFEINAVQLKLETLTFQAKGQLKLNSDLQPRGTLELRLDQLPQFVDGLIAEGIIGGWQARMVGGVIKSMASEQEDGSRPVILPIQLDDTSMSVGGIPIGPVPQIRW